MKSSAFSFCRRGLVVPVLLSCGWLAHANPSTPGSSAPTPVPQAGEPVVIKSVFNVPRNPQEGKDPFFPTSTRLFGSVAKNASEPSAPPRVELLLKGFSGPMNRRLAIINNYTFAAGESADVRTSNGRVRVQCLEIKTDSVIIRVGEERRELRLRNGV